jgi:YggT family protein
MLDQLVALLGEALTVLVILNIILPWIPALHGHPIGRLLWGLGEVVLAPFRRLIPPIRSGSMSVDLSPLLCLVAIRLVTNLLINLL